MSVAASSWVWQHSTTTGTTFLVMLALADQADDQGRCWPSIAYLAGKCRIAERTVQDAIARAVEAGEVERIERPGSSNVFRLVLGGADSAPPGVRGAAPGGAGGRTPGVRGAAPRTINEPSGTHGDPSGVASSTLDGMPDPQPRHVAGRLVAAWCRGYTSTGRPQPATAQTKRVGRSATQLMPDLGTEEARWVQAEEFAEWAGRQGLLDLVIALDRYVQGQPGTSSPSSRSAAILARAAERAGGGAR